jgi:glutamate-1-semialdehyde 2,1-aminomutase
MNTDAKRQSTSSISAELYRRAKRVIPGGTNLLSKRPERFLPDHWPAYYSRAKGNEVWDLDGRRLIDMVSAGCGTCLLGAADPDVDAAVKQVIDHGSMATLNAPEEVRLAELLSEIHPWADMARFARSGGESNAIAVRIGRAFTQKSKIAFCGYHGWHDWYLAANLSADSALDGHLMPGLDVAGVPRSLVGTALPFRYNHVEDLEQIVAEHGPDLGVIIMEPMRFTEPASGFLENVRDIATRLGAVLIFDEINIGFRHGLGGIHQQLGVEPDIAVYAKVLSNGYAMGAVVGRGPVMQAAQTTFISSSYFTERIGPAAAVATIEKMKRENVQDRVVTIGQRVREALLRTADKHGINLTVHGRPALMSMAMDYADETAALRTLFTQEMLDRGFIAGMWVYPNFTMTDWIIDDYSAALDEVFALLADAIDNRNISSRLRGPVAHADFRRLT